MSCQAIIDIPKTTWLHGNLQVILIDAANLFLVLPFTTEARVTFLVSRLQGWRKDEIDGWKMRQQSSLLPKTMAAAQPIVSASAFFKAVILMTSSCNLGLGVGLT
ncbi:hypothetical protein EV2_015284 [Malus domestica]